MAPARRPVAAEAEAEALVTGMAGAEGAAGMALLATATMIGAHMALLAAVAAGQTGMEEAAPPITTTATTKGGDTVDEAAGAVGVTMGRRQGTTGQDAEGRGQDREGRGQDRLEASTVITTGGMTVLLAAEAVTAVTEAAVAMALLRTRGIGAPDFSARLRKQLSGCQGNQAPAGTLPPTSHESQLRIV